MNTEITQPANSSLVIRYGNTVSDYLRKLHEATGIPWVYLIPLSTLTIRTVFTLPLNILQRKRIIKQQELGKLIQSNKPIIRLRLAQTGKLNPEQVNILTMKEYRKRQKQIYRQFNVPLWRNIALPLVQLPIWMTNSIGIRQLTELKVSRATGDWFNDLSYNGIDLTGPLLDYPVLVPLVLGYFSMFNVELNKKMLTRYATSNVGLKVKKQENSLFDCIIRVSRIGCLFMMSVSSQTSLLLSLYWITSQFYSLCQNMILDKLYPYQR